MKKRMFSAILALILMLSVFNLSTLADNNILTDKGYESISSNEKYNLYANMSTGDFALEDLSDGYIWYSGQWDVLDDTNPISEMNVGRIKTDLVSMIAVNYVQVSTIANTSLPSYQNSYAYCVLEGNVETKRIKNGYRAEFYFGDIGWTIPIEIILTKKGIKVSIIGSEIKKDKKYWITSIEVLPGFMAAENSSNGYLFVPSGSGAIVPYNTLRGEMSTYCEMVYGDDIAIEVEEKENESRNILAPVYGIVRDGHAITAIITNGDGLSEIKAEADSLSSTFTRVLSRYIISNVGSTTLFESDYFNQRIIYGIEKRKEFCDYSIEFQVLSKDKADYSGMAEAYRDYLALKQKSSKPSLYITLYGSATKKASFLGVPYTKKISLTSFKEAEKIIEYFNNKGITVSVQYVGWNNNGIENKKVTKSFSPVGVVGGKSGFKKLNKFIKDTKNDIYFDNDFFNIKKSSIGFSVLSDVCKSIFNTRTPQYKYLRSVYVPVNNEKPSYILNPDSVKKAADKFLKDYKYDAGLSLANFGESLYSDFSDENNDRNKTLNIFKGIAEDFSKEHKLAVSVGNAYTYKYADKIFSLPMTNDGNLIFSKSVPFVQMVLHGSVEYSAENGASVLDCIEYGATPYFEGIYLNDSKLIETTFNWLSGKTYTKWNKRAVDQFKTYNSVYSDLYNKKIVKHFEEDNVTTITFEDDSKIVINRKDTAVLINGVEIKAQDYFVFGRS